MTIVLTKLNNITHTRIIKFLHDFYINGSYQIKKIGKPSSNEYSVDFINNINTDSFFKYLKSQGIDYIKENKMKLTSKQKQLVKEYAKSLQEVSIPSANAHPWVMKAMQELEQDLVYYTGTESNLKIDFPLLKSKLNNLVKLINKYHK